MCPLGSQAFTQMAKEEIELHLGLRYRHDLGGVEGTNRGWKGVGLVEKTQAEKLGNGSAESERSSSGLAIPYNCGTA